jgi:hypothetical protein
METLMEQDAPPPPPPPAEDAPAPAQWVEDDQEERCHDIVKTAFGTTADVDTLDRFTRLLESGLTRLQGSARRTGTACTVTAVDLEKFPSDVGIYPDVGQQYSSLTQLSLALGLHEQSINVRRSRLRKAGKDADNITVRGVTIQII